jgi:hypothetical protein
MRLSLHRTNPVSIGSRKPETEKFDTLEKKAIATVMKANHEGSEKDKDVSSSSNNNNNNNNSLSSGGSIVLNIPSSVNEQENEDGLRFTKLLTATSATVMQISAGTKQKLTERLTYEEAPNPDYVLDFIMTYPCFVASEELLDSTINRFLSAESHKNEAIIRLRVLNVLKCWVEQNGHVFLREEELRARLLAFVDGPMVKAGMTTAASSIKTLLERIAKDVEKNLSDFYSPRMHGLDKDFMKIGSQELATQLTILHFQLLKQISTEEFYVRITGAPTSPSDILLRLFKLSKATKSWVRAEVERGGNDALNKFVEIADLCLSMHNFHAVFDLTLALQEIMKDSKRKTNKVELYTGLLHVIDGKDAYANYKHILRTATLPCIPWLGEVVREIEQVKAQPKEMSGGSQTLINFSKYRALAHLIYEMKKFQQVPYPANVTVPHLEAREFLKQNLDL